VNYALPLTQIGYTCLKAEKNAQNWHNLFNGFGSGYLLAVRRAVAEVVMNDIDTLIQDLHNSVGIKTRLYSLFTMFFYITLVGQSFFDQVEIGDWTTRKNYWSHLIKSPVGSVVRLLTDEEQAILTKWYEWKVAKDEAYPKAVISAIVTKMSKATVGSNQPLLDTFFRSSHIGKNDLEYFLNADRLRNFAGELEALNPVFALSDEGLFAGRSFGLKNVLAYKVNGAITVVVESRYWTDVLPSLVLKSSSDFVSELTRVQVDRSSWNCPDSDQCTDSECADDATVYRDGQPQFLDDNTDDTTDEVKS